MSALSPTSLSLEHISQDFAAATSSSSQLNTKLLTAERDQLLEENSQLSSQNSSLSRRVLELESETAQLLGTKEREWGERLKEATQSNAALSTEITSLREQLEAVQSRQQQDLTSLSSARAADIAERDQQAAAARLQYEQTISTL